MFTNNFDPVAFEIFSISIRWYSLAYIFGIIFGWIYCKKILIKNYNIQNLFEDYITYLIIGLIIGGRLGYVIFYNLIYFLNNPIEIFMIWNGGMSFHGGLIGIIFSTYLFSKKNNEDIYIFLDLIAITAPIGIFLGRISNFINAELYGVPTEKPWGVIFPSVDTFARHPSQIYEALLEGLILFLILNLLVFFKRNKFGLISGVFLIFYGLFRIICEQFREPDDHIGYIFNYLSIGTLLSFGMILFGIIFLKIVYGKENK